MLKIEETLNKLLRILKIHLSEHGYPPTVRELMQEMNVKSTSTIFYYLTKLEERGKIRKGTNKNRAIEIIPDYSQSLNEQFCTIHKITIKKPLSLDYYNQSFKVSANLFNGDLFAISVDSDSMTGIGIIKGDLAIIKKQTYADNGDIILCVINNEPIFRRFFRQDGNIMLKAYNNKYAPQYFFDVKILGRVVGIIRFL
ncbi:MAG: transcriptional repressor LexA [Christensenellaceae bacterium]|jgi:repressor LexA|nr:transcriptional repressor LexA [Christensenellaceae bacterium]